jgi:hypothetical protein
MEVDLYPRAAPDRAIDIDGTLGDGSQFHSTFGYFAHGVGPETAMAPAGWQERLVPVAVPQRVGSARSPVAYCLEVHDLVLAKCVRGDDRDWSYAKAALEAGLVDRDTLLDRSDDLPIAAARRSRIRQRLSVL